MKNSFRIAGLFLVLLISVGSHAADSAPKIPRFSTNYMDVSVKPADDFYHYAAGNWIKNNPVPADKSRWASFTELQERNWYLIHEILDSSLTGAVQANSPAQQVGDFFRSATDTNRIELLGFKPIEGDLKQIADVKSVDDIFRLLAGLHYRGIGGLFDESVSPDAKKSDVYAFHL